MDCLSSEGIEIYSKALNHYKTKKYEAAEELLLEMPEVDRQYAKVLLLQAYIFRSRGEYVSEINFLLENEDAFSLSSKLNLQAERYSLLGEAYNLLGEHREAVSVFLQSSQKELEHGRTESAFQEYSNAIFASAAINDFSVDEVQNLFAGYRELLQKYISPLSKVEYKHDKIRIGYLSSDLKKHPVGNFLFPLVKNFSDEDFKVYCYSGVKEPDGITLEFKRFASAWRDVSNLSFEEIAQVIRKDEIDILVETSGHTCENMLPVLVYKPAPVQVSAIGWVGSTGLAETDYIIGDKYCVIGEGSQAYTEKMLALPYTHFCYHSFADNFPAVEQLPLGKNGYITFGCFNNFSKITDEMLTVWGEILEQVPNSKLILKHKILGYEEGRQLAFARLQMAGIDIDRVELRDFSLDYLQQYNDVDIALDTYPYVGGMTTFEALYMGVPVISRYGMERGNRFGYSILSNAGLDMLTAESAEEYVAKAVIMTENIALLEKLRYNLRSMVTKSPLMDEELYVAGMENIYRKIFGESICKKVD